MLATSRLALVVISTVILPEVLNAIAPDLAFLLLFFLRGKGLSLHNKVLRGDIHDHI